MSIFARIAASLLVALAGNALAATPPGAPTHVLAIPGNARATIHLAPPASDGGALITTYTVTASPGGATASAPGWPLVVTGLTNGVAYTFTARATNASGQGPASAASNPVTPNLPTITPAISSEESFALALDSHGQAYAWGSDAYGQLGQGRKLLQTTPVLIGGLPPITQFSLFEHVLALDSTGQVWSWGDPICDELGARESGVTNAPSRVVGATGMVKVGAGYCRSFMLRSDGTVWSIGYGGALLQVPGLSGITDISIGGYHLLALASDHTVWAYGPNDKGQLGIGTTNPSNDPVQVPGLTHVTKISAGFDSSLVLDNGQLKFWGQYDGQNPPILSPTNVTGLPVAGTPLAISASGSAIAVVASDGTVWRWNASISAPTQVSGMSGAAGVEYCANMNALFSIGTTGALLGNGSNNGGQLAQGDTSVHSGTVAVSGFSSGTKQVRVGFFTPAVVALKTDGSLWFWGQNSAGQRGDGVFIGSSVPLAVPIPATVKLIAAGSRYAVAVDTTGQGWAWGANFSGAYDANLVSRSSPATVPWLTNVNHIAAAGFGLTAYARSDGTAGWNGTDVPALSNIVGVAALFNTPLFLRNDGAVFGVGSNVYGELGDGTTTYSPTPVQVHLPGPATKIVARDFRAAALLADGRVFTWGADFGGSSLTNGTNLPVQVNGIANAVDVEVSGNGGLARLAGGNVAGWAQTLLGEAPPGVLSTSLGSYSVAIPQAIQAMALAQRQGYFLGSTGLLWAWGLSAASQIQGMVGDGTYVTRTAPVVVLAHDASGSLDVNNWFLDLQPDSAETVPAGSTPTAIASSRLFGGGGNIGFDGTIKYLSADLGKAVNQYVLALVPPQFFDQVKAAPGADSKAARTAKAAKDGGYVLAQLTPAGWTDVNGQLIAYSQGTASAAGGASSILKNVNPTTIPGARFCVGYGQTADAMLGSQSLREVLRIDGAATTASNVPCVLSGVYVSGPASSIQSSTVTFSATVVGLNPGGTVQFKDNLGTNVGNLGSPVTLAATNPAVSTAAFTTSSLAVGAHSIVATYSGDTANSAIGSAVPLIHVVSVQSQVALDGPVSSALGAEVAFVATVTGSSPTGSVELRDNQVPTGVTATIVQGRATLRISSLTLGNHSLTASYAGDSQGNSSGNSPALPHVVTNLIPPQVTLSSSANPAAYFASVTIAVSVSGMGTPSGNVTLRDNGSPVGTKALSGGAASFLLASLPAGVHQISADYAGDGGSNGAATSGTLFQQVLVPPPALTVSKSGQGSGTVSSNAGGINCGGTCSTTLPTNSGVTLSATPAAGSVFVGWSGACTGSSNCVLTMSEPRAVTARFELPGTLVTGAPASLAFGGQSMHTTAPAQSTTVTNNSGGTIGVTSIDLPSGFGASHNCSSVANGATCTVTITFTPVAEGPVSGNAALNFNPAAQVALIGVSGTGEKSLVTHYYRSILRRAPDAGGKTYWEGEAARMQGLGANVNETWFAMAQYFYFSDEYKAFGRDDMGFVTDLYTTFFNRAPDPGGLGYWTGLLGQGMPREVVLTSFMFSTEFVAFAQGIFGNTAARAEIDVVMDFYRGLLARLPDDGGFASWVGNFHGAQCQGGAQVAVMADAISNSFTGSAEYTQKNRTNAQYVGDLYNAFLRRGGDLGGVQFWINQLGTSAMTRDVVRKNFVASAEFNARVANIVSQGCGP